MTITTEKPRNGVGLIRIDRLEKMNSIDVATEAALRQAWAWAEADDDIRCVVLTGAGDRAFCTGADITSYLWELKRRIASNEDDGAFCGLTRTAPTRKPIIAAINGAAFGGGLELALACDIRIAAANARMGLPEVTVGVVAAGGGMSRLPRLVPPAIAVEMLLTGDAIDAETALRIGLVSRVVAQENLLETALALAEKIASRAPLSVERTVALTRRAHSLGLLDSLSQERQDFLAVTKSQDTEEGIAAFTARRAPNFRGK